MKKYNVAILGATGAVGKEFLNLIEERDFPFADLKMLASKRSAGKVINFMGKDYTVEEATADSFKDVDIALFAGGAASQEFAPAAVKAGAVVIDNSSAFRMNPEVPLVVPEVNPEDIGKHKGIIANPNCTTAILLMALKPLHDIGHVKRLIISTYQAASGAGKEGMEELEVESQQLARGEATEPKIFPVGKLPKHYQLAFNAIPQVDVFLENGYTKEEMKMVNETRKILHEPQMPVTATTVRIPVYRSHAESITVEFDKKVTLEAAREAIDKFPGVILRDNTAEQVYPMPLETSGKNDVEVGRLRYDESVENGLNFWVCGDQIRKGAALNALQIAEYMIEHDMVK